MRSAISREGEKRMTKKRLSGSHVNVMIGENLEFEVVTNARYSRGGKLIKYWWLKLGSVWILMQKGEWCRIARRYIEITKGEVKS
jgi:hypothetical protein